MTWVHCVSYVLLGRVGSFDLHDLRHVAAAGIPALAISVFAARGFGRFNGGNHPPVSEPKGVSPTV